MSLSAITRLRLAGVSPRGVAPAPRPSRPSPGGRLFNDRPKPTTGRHQACGGCAIGLPVQLKTRAGERVPVHQVGGVEQTCTST